MPNTTTSASLLLCEGKNCFRKANRDFCSLRSLAQDSGLEVGTVKCQGACTGPTAVVIDSKGTRWFQDLKGHKAQRDLCLFASNNGKPSKRLRSRELTGKKRAKAKKRLARIR